MHSIDIGHTNIIISMTMHSSVEISLFHCVLTTCKHGKWVESKILTILCIAKKIYQIRIKQYNYTHYLHERTSKALHL